MSKQSTPELTKVRIDKWLWAARFFKTRNIAKQAIEGGKVHVNGQRAKASKEIELGMTLTIRRGWDELEVTVEGLSEQRRGAPEAQKLYNETNDSIEKRKLHSEQRKTLGILDLRTDTKPNTKQRRQIHRLKRELFE
ncbi:RNA-binding S4 domain-containing protein [Teredinibacter sp. KSP-S5-2]|uniref:RNA-binding S4 domain-containing protein n=1 Tax=Teredinibacter sp. KSP-S5-2 TaxID=3034506 RepID=UPI00293446B8|nr:S4 domain-containing protein [Teredinibacter sp. KSP-S5-2]WNO09364.1 S4 domain-containing protein [Teredinibacter sp. KSP-S5-2]